MTVLFTDSGAGDDASPIGGPYTTITGFNPLRRLENEIGGTANSANNGAWINSVAAQEDCYIEAAIAGGTLNSVGLMLRLDDDDGYVFQVFGGTPMIARFDGGSYSNLATGDAVSYTQGDVMRFEAVGTVLTAKYNGATVVTYDTASDETKYASGRFGLYSFVENNFLSNIEAGNFASDGGGSPIPIYANMRRVQ